MPSSDPSKYRPITLLPLIFKLFEALIQSQLYHWLEEQELLAEPQAGFRQQRGIFDPLTVLRLTSENLDPTQDTLYFCFLDAKKTFWLSLEKQAIP